MQLMKRDYYTQALPEMLAELDHSPTEEERAFAARACQRFEARLRSPAAEPDPERLDWFKGLEEAVLAFAEALCLDVTMAVDARGYGVISFEGALFLLSHRDAPELREFWQFLCTQGSLSVSPGEDVACISFAFPLF